MPFTFSHPAAVLPFLPLCYRLRRGFHFPALVIGSLLPDLSYYVPCFALARSSHALSALWLDVPLNGACLLLLFYGLRNAVVELLPSPHREALLPLAKPLEFKLPGRQEEGWNALHHSIPWLFSATISLMLGAATHLFWDGFTHVNGWAVKALPALREPVFSGLAGASGLHWYYALQQISTVAGAGILAWAYLRWLRRTTKERMKTPLSQAQRVGLLLGLAALSIIVALPPALEIATGYHGFLAVRVGIFQLITLSVGFFGVAFLATAAGFSLWHSWHRQSD